MQHEFGEVLRNIRIENGWTLEEMAKRLGTTKQAISKYERGERTPKITVAAKFADILGVPLEILIGYEYHEEDPCDYYARTAQPQSEEARILVKAIDKLSPEQRVQALAVVKAMFAAHPEIFEEGDNDNGT